MKKIIVFLIGTIVAFGSEYKIGDSISPMKLVDQFGVIHSLDRTPKTIIIAFEKEPSSKVHKFLASKPKEFLKSNDVAYIAEISQMPAFVSKMFAIPAMRKYNHHVLLIKDELVGERFPAKEDKITIIKTKNGKIDSIEFAENITSI